MLPTSLVPLLEVLKTVPGIRAIVVGGSRARGSWDAVSDTDLGLYYDPQYPPAVEALDQVAATYDDRKQSGLVTEIGGWGPWINGGGWSKYPEALRREQTLRCQLRSRLPLPSRWRSSDGPFRFKPGLLVERKRSAEIY